MRGYTENSLTVLAIFFTLLLARCGGQEPIQPEGQIDSTGIQSQTLEEFQAVIDTMIDYPQPVVAKMTALENYEQDPLIDENLLSVWQRERWDGSTGFQDFFSNGSGNSNFGNFEYTTFRFQEINWLITIKREPHLGRSIQAYYIKGDSLYLKFLNPEAEWECCHRPDLGN